MPDALYEIDGERVMPSPLTAGPWSADAQHGGAVAAILARTIECVSSPVPAQVVRLTIELLRPAPIEPLSVSATIARAGRKVQVIEARMITAGGKEIAWARAVRIRSIPVAGVASASPGPAFPPLPGTDEGKFTPDFRVPFAEVVDIRFVEGNWETPGPAKIWTRLTVPVVEGETPTALQRTAAGADFGNGVSRVLDFDSHIFINSDLTVALSRPPVGEWIGFDVVTRLSPDGYGQAEGMIFDPAGPVGRSVQSLIVEER